MEELDKIYTKTGDKGTTALYTGERVDKDSFRVEAYGTIDELDSVLGMARSVVVSAEVKETIYKLQKDLWMLMADIASLGVKEPNISEDNVTHLEGLIDYYQGKLEPVSEFLVPGSTYPAGVLDLARTVARRAERALWRVSRTEEVHESNLKYLNRLSDLCYTLGRIES